MTTGINPIDVRSIENKQAAINALDALVSSDGWKLYVVWLEGQKQMNVKAMCEAEATTDQLHKLSGQTRLLNVVTAWPKQTADVLRKQVELEAKKAK